jgi:hypothetical protein
MHNTEFNASTNAGFENIQQPETVHVINQPSQALNSFKPVKGLTRKEIQLEEKRRKEKRELPLGDWMAQVVAATFDEAKRQYIVALSVNVMNETGNYSSREHKEYFFLDERKSFSKLGLLDTFMGAVGLEDWEDDSVRTIIGTQLIITVAKVADKQNPTKMWSNITNYAQAVKINV